MRSILETTPEPIVMPKSLTAEQRREYEGLRISLVNIIRSYDIVQKMLADACSISQQTISIVLTGKGTAVETLLRIAMVVKGQRLKAADKLEIRVAETRVRDAFRVKTRGPK